MMPFRWTQHLPHEIPQIEYATSIQLTTMVVKKGDDLSNERNVIVADTSFFKIFDFPVIKGNAERFFHDPNGIVLEEKMAIKYFGNIENALNQTLRVGLSEEFNTFRIEGVVRCPINSHIQFDFLIPYEPVIRNSFNPPAYERFTTHFVYTYVYIPSGFDHDHLQSRFKEFLIKYGGESLSEKYTTSFQPLCSVYLDSTLNSDFTPRGSRRNVNILWIVAFLILIISSVNFVNLSTARSIRRIKEVGIRKVFGSGRRALIIQFLTESVLITFLACLVALLLLILALPFIRDLSEVNFNVFNVVSLSLFGVLLGITLVVGLLAGLYPPVLVSSFDTMQILRSNDNPRSGGSIVRKVLITIQFGIAILLLVGTFVIRDQLNFMVEKDLGIESEQVMVIGDRSTISNDRDKILLLRSEIESEEIISVTTSSTYPGVPSWSVGFLPEGYDEQVSFACIFTDHQFARTYDIPIVLGRDLDMDIGSDSAGFLINETAMRHFSNFDSTWATNPIGKNIKSNYLKMDGPVIGVMQDFHFESVHSQLRPLIVMVYPRLKSSVQLRLKTENANDVLTRIEEVWTRLNPSIPFEYQFIDDVFDRAFRADRRLTRLFGIFSIISIMLAMVGLFGLTSFLTKEKLKVSSIKKVLGAANFQIALDLIKPILLLLGIAMAVSIPLSYLLMDKWLENFPYRIIISPGILMIVVLLIVLISLVTISFHVIKLIVSNPIIELRQE